MQQAPLPAAAAATRSRQPLRAPLATAIAADRELSSGPPSTSGQPCSSLLVNGRRGRVAGSEHSLLTIRAARFAQRVNEDMWHRQLAGDLLEGGWDCGLFSLHLLVVLALHYAHVSWSCTRQGGVLWT